MITNQTIDAIRLLQNQLLLQREFSENLPADYCNPFVVRFGLPGIPGVIRLTYYPEHPKPSFELEPDGLTSGEQWLDVQEWFWSN